MDDSKNFKNRMWPFQCNEYFDGSDDLFVERLYETISKADNLAHPALEFKLEFTPM